MRFPGISFFENMVVDLGSEGEPPMQLNPHTGGKRDVRRLEVSEAEAEVHVHVVRERNWHVVDFSVPDLTEERVVPLHTARFADGAEAGHDSALGLPGSFRGEPATEREARLAAASECDREGKVGLWEWSRIAHVSDEGAVPAEMWGVYSESQERQIEEAFRAGEPGVTVSVGIRTYEVTFRGANGGRQEDKTMRKRRLVRRRVMTRERREAELAAGAATTQDPSLANGDCAICCTSFAETEAVPVVRLPGCNHCFHGACVQQLADERGTCPFCRAEVDWATALAPHARSLPRHRGYG